MRQLSSGPRAKPVRPDDEFDFATQQEYLDFYISLEHRIGEEVSLSRCPK